MAKWINEAKCLIELWLAIGAGYWH